MRHKNVRMRHTSYRMLLLLLNSEGLQELQIADYVLYETRIDFVCLDKGLQADQSMAGVRDNPVNQSLPHPAVDGLPTNIRQRAGEIDR
jgi:hypothetical protein